MMRRMPVPHLLSDKAVSSEFLTACGAREDALRQASEPGMIPIPNLATEARCSCCLLRFAEGKQHIIVELGRIKHWSCALCGPKCQDKRRER